MAALRLSREQRAYIIMAMCEGMPVNGICRMLGVSKRPVLRVLQEVGAACEDWHNEHFRNLQVGYVEADEQWSFVHTHKERMSEEQERLYPERGDSWLWAAIDADSKAVLSWRTGKRTNWAAQDLIDDLAARIEGRVQITTDGLNHYKFAIRGAFGHRADHASEDKTFRACKIGPELLKRRVDPLVGVTRKRVTGIANLKRATTTHIERFFLTVRQTDKRSARKTLAYSKDWENHAFAASVHCFVYNMVRKHETLGTAPAVKLGLIRERWKLEDVIDMTDAFLKRQETAAFEAAFASVQFATRPKPKFVPYEPQQPELPWYLNP